MRINTNLVLLLAIITLMVMALAFTLTKLTILVAFGVTLGITIFALAFLSTEAALYILLFSMLLSPEIPVYKFATRVAEGRASLNIRLEDILLGIMLFSYLAKMAIHKELGVFLRTPLNRPIFLYILLCLFSTALGALFGNVRPASGILYLIKYTEYFIVYFMVVNHLRTRDQIKRFTFVFLVTGIIVCLYAIYHIQILDRVSTPFETETGGAANTLGGYLVFLIAICSGLAMSARKIRPRSGYLLLILLVLPPLAYAKSRGAYLSLVPIFFVLFFLGRHKKFLTVLLLAALVTWPILLPGDIVERVKSTFIPGGVYESVAGMQLDYSASARIEGYREALAGWLKRPLFGHGITGFKFIDGMYFRTLVELGIVGISVFFWLLWTVFRESYQAFKSSRGDPYLNGLALGFLAGFFGLLMNAVPLNTFVIIRVMEPFWFFAGVMVMIPTILEREALDMSPVIKNELKPRVLRAVST